MVFVDLFDDKLRDCFTQVDTTRTYTTTLQARTQDMRIDGENMERLSKIDLACAKLREQQIFQDVHPEPRFRSFYFHSHRGGIQSPEEFWRSFSKTETKTDIESAKQTGRQKAVLQERQKDQMLPPPAPAPVPKKARRLN